MIPLLKIELLQNLYETLAVEPLGLARIVKDEQATWTGLGNSLLLITHLMILLAIFVMKPLILIIVQLLLIAQNVSIEMVELLLVEIDLMEANLEIILIPSLFSIPETIKALTIRMSLFEVLVQ